MNKEKYLSLCDLLGSDLAHDVLEQARNISELEKQDGVKFEPFSADTWCCKYCGNQVSLQFLKCPSCGGTK